MLYVAKAITVGYVHRVVVSCLLLIFLPVLSHGQKLGVSANVADWVALMPNAEIELVCNSHISLDMNFSLAAWDTPVKSVSLRHVRVAPELRYWFKNPMYAHYIGFHTVFAAYDVQMRDEDRYKGLLAAVGIGYGYSFMVGKRWNIVPNIGIGYGYVRRYADPEKQEFSEVRNQFVPLITKIGISIQYIIK